ncbi:MAG: hypothetical protein DRO88_08420 [Promethearchaeia archaeon]|nr:MAG: hypothetical protein DRO88_08420 [Candidatus Lokiarchaeia archaeon]
MDDEIFSKYLKTESVFKDQQSLNQAWVPTSKQKIICRQNELKKLLLIHRPIIQTQGEFSTNTLVLGKGGIGKTVTIRYFGKRFREAVLKEDIKLTIEYYDCLQHRTKSSILRNISERLHYSAGHGYSDNEIMEQILKELIKRKESLLIILDEVHKLPPDDILSLLNASIGFGEQNTRFCIICISRESDWFKVDNEKISSRIQEVIKMQPYNKEESFEILQYRRNLAFRDGVLEDDVLELIADIVYEQKNMRTGIDIMRSCGLHADEQMTSTITPEMVLQSRESVSPSFRADILDNLSLHEHLTLWAIAAALKHTGNPFTKVDESFEFYKMKCEELGYKPHVQMSFRKYIRNLSSVKAIYKEYLNPTSEKKGRQIQIKLTDITPEKLCDYFEKRIPPKA